MTRILVLTTSYPPHHYGGYELICQDVVSRWRSDGHQVTVLTSNTTLPSKPDSGDTREEVLRQLNVSLKSGQLAYPSLRLRRKLEQENQSVLLRVLQAVKPEVISVWHMLGMSSGLLLSLIRMNLPVVCVVGDEWPRYLIQTDQWMRLWRRWPILWPGVERILGVPTGVPDVGASATLCFASEYLRNRCAESSPSNFARSSVIHHGIDSALFPVTRHQKTEWSWRLITAGRLDPRKGFATAISSIGYLPAEAHLTILSPVDDPYRHDLIGMAYRWGVSDRVAFRVCDRATLREEYLAADALIFPSEWPEPFGLVPIEAMACGIPVVATCTGGSGEFLLDERSCLQFDAGDARSLASGVTRLAASAELRNRLVTAGWKLAEELTVDRLARALSEWHTAAAQGFPEGQLPDTPALRPSAR